MAESRTGLNNWTTATDSSSWQPATRKCLGSSMRFLTSQRWKSRLFEGVFQMYPWRAMYSMSTYSSAILFSLKLQAPAHNLRFTRLWSFAIGFITFVRDWGSSGGIRFKPVNNLQELLIWYVLKSVYSYWYYSDVTGHFRYPFYCVLLPINPPISLL